MSEIRRTQAARQDVRLIWRYIAKDSVRSADEVIERFDEKLRMLAENPKLGSQRPELGASLRSFACGNYVLFFEPIPSGIRLLRILHGARNATRELRRD